MKPRLSSEFSACYDSRCRPLQGAFATYYYSGECLLFLNTYHIPRVRSQTQKVDHRNYLGHRQTLNKIVHTTFRIPFKFYSFNEG